MSLIGLVSVLVFVLKRVVVSCVDCFSLGRLLVRVKGLRILSVMFFFLVSVCRVFLLMGGDLVMRVDSVCV